MDIQIPTADEIRAVVLDALAEINDQHNQRREWLSTAQLAEYLGVSESTVTRMRNSGRIPCVRMCDKTYRYHLDDVDAALRERTI